MRRLRTWVGGLLAVGALGLVAAGCGGAIPSSSGNAVKLTSTGVGRFLVDGRGHTLYLFARDEGGESYCNGACAAVWPPFEAEERPQAAGIPASALGTITRAGGERQVTYRGHPLYYYAADASTPGKTKGEAVEQFGAEWYVVGRNGKAVEPHRSDGKSNDSNTPKSGGY